MDMVLLFFLFLPPEIKHCYLCHRNCYLFLFWTTTAISIIIINNKTAGIKGKLWGIKIPSKLKRKSGVQCTQNHWHYIIGGEHAIDKMPVPNPSGVPLFVGVLLFHIWSILLSKPDIHHSNCSWLKLILVLNIGLWLTLVMVSVSKDAYCWWINSWTANMVNQHWPLMKPHSQPSSGNDGRPNKQDDQQHLLIGKLCELHDVCCIALSILCCMSCFGVRSCIDTKVGIQKGLCDTAELGWVKKA